MLETRGLLFIGDPHVASRPPGFRKDDYPLTILGKLAWAMEYAKQNALRPVILGDLFDFPRDNANWLLVRLLDLFDQTLAVYGNHDCKENALGENDTLSILWAAGAIRLLDRKTPWRGRINGREVIIGGTPWGQELPESFDPAQAGDRAGAGEGLFGERPLVFWIAHHDLRFAGAEEHFRNDCREIPGIDMVVNGHIHRACESIQAGQTLWVNPGNIARIRRTDITRQQAPAVLRVDITAGAPEFERIEVPHRPFDEVFHAEIAGGEINLDESAFVKGLKSLEERQTGGAGLMDFLKMNLPQFEPDVQDEINQLAREVVEDGR